MQTKTSVQHGKNDQSIMSTWQGSKLHLEYKMKRVHLYSINILVSATRKTIPENQDQ